MGDRKGGTPPPRGELTLRKTRVFVVTYGGGHVNAIVPVIRSLQNDYGLDVTVLGATIAGSELTRLGILHKQFGHYVNSSTLVLGAKYAEHIHNPATAVSFAETAAYTGANMVDLIQEFGLDRAEKLLHHFGRRVFCPVGWMGEVLQSERPDVVLTTNVPRAELACRIAAHRLGIPTVAIEDLFGQNNGLHLTGTLIVHREATRSELEYRGVPGDIISVARDTESFGIPSMYTGIEDYVGFRYSYYADRVAVMSEVVAQNMVARGISGDSITVTGQPAFDGLAGLEFKSQRKCREDLGLPRSRKLVLYLERFSASPAEFQAVVAAMKRLRGAELVVKPHPGEPEAPHRQLAESNGVRCHVLDEATLAEAIGAADVVVVKGSTAGFTSVLMGKPLLVVNLSGLPDYVPYVESGVALGAHELEQVLPALHASLAAANGPVKPDVVRSFIDVDGLAARRVAGLVAGCL